MNERRLFHDRREAGQLLARRLTHYQGREDVLVLALPRGGVPVASEIARELKAPLDVFVVRKLGVPWQPELAMGAIAGRGTEVLNGDVITAYNIPAHVIRTVAERESEELQRRLERYRGDRPFPDARARTVILVDDGLATGSSMRAAIGALKKELPRSIVVAVPVAAARTCEETRRDVDEVVCLLTPKDFSSVGAWYEDFSQTTDEAVRELLVRAQSLEPKAQSLESRAQSPESRAQSRASRVQRPAEVTR
ncbi:MAG TPA: phosphoribosyltransferase [Vicinamibacterales bacterium]|nr:phosphoribosyltransferase [Vicinamibacterales bacterium]